MTLGFVAALVAGALRSDQRFYAIAASNLVMTINMLAIWVPWRGISPKPSA